LISLDSEPKINFDILRAFKSSKEASAKISAELLPKIKGSSITKLTPYFKASLVFSSFVSSEMIPLSRK